MPKFKDREEYERWKAERLRQAAEKDSIADNTEGKKPDTPEEEFQRQGSSGGLTGIGELLDRTWEVYKRRFGTLLGLNLIMIVFFILPLAIFGGGGFALALLLPGLKVILIGVFAAIGITVALITFTWGMSGLLCAVTDETLTIKTALGDGWPKVWGLICLLSVFGFLTTGGFLLLIIPGIIFTVWFIFGQFIFIEGDERGMRALLKSKELVRGYGFEVFIRLLVVWIISAGIGMIPLVGSLLSFLFAPFMMIFFYLIYKDLKTLKGDVSVVATTGEKLKWIGIATLGYILIPVLILALFWASLMSSLILLKGLLSSQGKTFF